MTFDDVVVGHIDWIARQACALCRNKADADDLAQETLLRILSNRDKYDARRDFKPWALTIMVNLFKTQRARRGRGPFVDVDDTDYDCIAPESVDGDVGYNDMLSVLRRAARMSVGVRAVTLYARGYTYEEIAQKEGIGIGTVKSRIAAGRKVIKRLAEGAA